VTWILRGEDCRPSIKSQTVEAPKLLDLDACTGDEAEAVLAESNTRLRKEADPSRSRKLCDDSSIPPLLKSTAWN
jgi:hypothetical protein